MIIDSCRNGIVSGNHGATADITVTGTLVDSILVSDNKVSTIFVEYLTTSNAADVPATVRSNICEVVSVSEAHRTSVVSNEIERYFEVYDSNNVVFKGNIISQCDDWPIYIGDSDDTLVLDNDIWGVGSSPNDNVVDVEGTSARTRIERNRYHGKAPSQAGTALNHGVHLSATAGAVTMGWNSWVPNLAAGPEIDDDGSAAITHTDVQEIDFIHFPDASTTVDSPIRKYFASDVEIIDVFIVADDGPVGADLIANIHVDGSGTGIFTTAPNKPTVSDGSNEGSTTVPDVTSVAQGSYLKVKFEQVGSTTPGGAVTILLRYRRV